MMIDRMRVDPGLSSVVQPGPTPICTITAGSLLLLLQGEEVGFVFDLGEVLGPIFAGDGDAEGQLFAVELVDALEVLPLASSGPSSISRSSVAFGLASESIFTLQV